MKEEIINVMVNEDYKKNGIKKMIKEYFKNLEIWLEIANETGNTAKCLEAFMKLRWLIRILPITEFQTNEEDIQVFSDELIKIAEKLKER